MMNKLMKALLLALAAALVSGKMKPKAKKAITAKTAADPSAPDILKPPSPITKAYWLLHPRKALYLWLFQKSFGFAWSLAKRYFRG